MLIGFIGLGNMGLGIAKNIGKKFNVLCYARNKEKYNICNSTLNLTENIYDLKNCNVIFLCLPDSNVVEEIINKIIEIVDNKIIVDLSTSKPSSTKQIYSLLKSHNANFIDMPLGGGPKNAEEGTNTAMIGGDKNIYEKLIPIIETFTKSYHYAGESGNGNIAKLAANCFSIIYTILYAEVFPAVEKLGLDPNILLNITTNSGSSSPIMSIFAPKIINQDYKVNFKLGLALKDLRYAKEMFQEKDMDLDLINLSISILEEGEKRGLSDSDYSSIAEIMREKYN